MLSPHLGGTHSSGIVPHVREPTHQGLSDGSASNVQYVLFHFAGLYVSNQITPGKFSDYAPSADTSLGVSEEPLPHRQVLCLLTPEMPGV